MRHLSIILTFVCSAFSLHLQAEKQPPPNDNVFNKVEYERLAALKTDGGQGVSAAYAGVSDGKVLVAGGCNFPDVPAASGGAKRFYDYVYQYDEKKDRWKCIGRLPQPMGYGVSVTTPEGVVCIGGTDGRKSLKGVFLMSCRNGLAVTQSLPDLPVPLDNMAGAYGGGYIYVAGGQTDGSPNYAAYRLAYPGGKSWERLPDCPGGARLQATAVVQSDGTETCFYLIGGFSPVTDAANGYVHYNGLIYSPKLNHWTTTSDILPQGRVYKMAVVGAQSVVSGGGHIVIMGGVDGDIFTDAINRPRRLEQTEGDSSVVIEMLRSQLQREIDTYLEHPAEWYRFNKELLIYHTVTDTWVVESSSPLLARAGAVLVPYGKQWIYIDGESKPGIRSSDVTAVKMTTRPNFGWVNWSVLGFYLVGMLLLGVYFMRREGDADDFFKGGGRIPWWAAGISIYATMLSAITYMAYPAKAYATDWTYYPMLVTILLVSFPVVKYYLPFFRRLKVASAYEYLEHRFNAATRLMASAVFITFMVARMALVLYLPSLALTAVTGIDIYVCIVLMGIVTIAYCTMGGVEAVVWGDVIQGFILVGGALLAVGYLVFNTEDGWDGFITIGTADDKFRMLDWSLDFRQATVWVVILGGMANNLISYTSDQTVIQRYLTTKDEAGARRSILMNGVMSVVISIVFFAIGAGLYTYFKTHPADLDFTMAKTDTIFPFFIMGCLPTGVAGLLIAAIFAATMSTISSNINSVATAFSVDFYKRWRPDVSERSMLRVARTACIVSGIVGTGIALLMVTWNILSLLDFFQEILGLLSSGLGGLFMMGIFFPRIGGKAALCGFCIGLIAVFLTKNLTDASFLLYGFVGLLASVLSGWLLSFVFRNPKNLDGLTWSTL